MPSSSVPRPGGRAEEQRDAQAQDHRVLPDEVAAGTVVPPTGNGDGDGSGSSSSSKAADHQEVVEQAAGHSPEARDDRGTDDSREAGDGRGSDDSREARDSRGSDGDNPEARDGRRASRARQADGDGGPGNEREDGAGRVRGARARVAAIVGGLTALAALPLVAALAAVRSPTWYPSVDLALIEMRVRDVGTRYTPLLGPGGRFTAYGEHGNHPGPIGYYLMAPVYRLLGADSWALMAAAASVRVAAVAVAAWVAYRRAGTIGALGAVMACALFIRLYGPAYALSPWNPHVPVLWWLVLLVAVWAILCRDWPMIPVAAFAAGVCVQSHLSYVGLTGGLMALVAAWALAQVARHAELRRPALRWGLAGLAVAGLVWLPVLVEQVSNDPGNLAILARSMQEPTEEPIDTSLAWTVAQRTFDIRPYVSAEAEPDSAVPAVTLLVTWSACAAIAIAGLRRPWLTRLHVVAGATAVLSFVTLTRITGIPWYYLTLWAHIAMLLLVASVAATAATLASEGLRRHRRPSPATGGGSALAGTPDAEQVPSAEVAPGRNDREGPVAPGTDPAAAHPRPGDEPAGSPSGRRPGWAERWRRWFPAPSVQGLRPLPAAAAPRLPTAALAALTVLVLGAATVEGARTETPEPELSSVADRLLGPTAAALDRSEGPDGPQGPTLLSFSDPVDLGSAAMTLLLALEREGHDVRMGPSWWEAVGDGRVVEIGAAARELHVSVGDADIELWRSDPRMTEVAMADPRSADEQARVRRVEQHVVDELEARGLHEVSRLFQGVRMASALDPRMPADLADAIVALGGFPQPVAVFLSDEPGARPPTPTPTPLPAGPAATAGNDPATPSPPAAGAREAEVPSEQPLAADAPATETRP